MTPHGDPKSNSTESPDEASRRPVTLDYLPTATTPRGPTPVEVPHALVRTRQWLASGSADLVSLAYCLIAGTIEYVFKCAGIVFVDAAAKKRRVKPGGDSPAGGTGGNS